MIEWTCYKCGFKYNSMTGDVDERMCYDCLEEEYQDEEYNLEPVVKLMDWAIEKLNKLIGKK